MPPWAKTEVRGRLHKSSVSPKNPEFSGFWDFDSNWRRKLETRIFQKTFFGREYFSWEEVFRNDSFETIRAMRVQLCVESFNNSGHVISARGLFEYFPPDQFGSENGVRYPRRG